MTKHNTGIEWTHIPGYKGETWNPIVGCSIASPGCKNCYAMRMAARLQAMEASGKVHIPHYADLTKKVNGKPVWTGRVTKAPEKTLTAPLRWKKPRAIFVNSMGDLFHKSVAVEWIAHVMATAIACPQHIFIILTKQSERMRDVMCDLYDNEDSPIGYAVDDLELDPVGWGVPIPNVWLGVSVEDRTRADERIPDLLETPAAVRFLSCEPLLGPIHLGYLGWPNKDDFTTKRNGHNALLGYRYKDGYITEQLPKLDWVIAGGESGPGARPMHPDWVRALRDQCKAANVPFFFKQWGEWAPFEATEPPKDTDESDYRQDVRVGEFHDGSDWIEGCICVEGDRGAQMYRVGKSRAGRLLDGIEHTAFPKCVEVESV